MVPLLGALFASLSREGARKTAGNALAVGIFTVLSNLVVLWRTALQVDVSKDGWQVVEKFNWLENPKIELVFGIRNKYQKTARYLPKSLLCQAHYRRQRLKSLPQSRFRPRL